MQRTIVQPGANRPSLLRTLPWLACMLVGLGSPSAGHAETLSCSGGDVDVGASRLDVMSRCGAPALQDSGCTPAAIQAYPPSGQAVPVCIPIDDWIYERGTGYLKVKLRFVNGVLRQIVYGDPPR